MGFSDAIHWILLPEWVRWVTVEKNGLCYGWASKPNFSDQLGRWIWSSGDYMQIPNKDASLEGLWERPAVIGKEFVLVADGQVGAKLKKEFLEFLTDRDIRLTKAQQKLGDVILEAAAGDSQLLQLLTEPASGLSFALRALDGFGDEKKGEWYKFRLDSEASAPLRAPYLVGDYVIQMQDKR